MNLTSIRRVALAATVGIAALTMAATMPAFAQEKAVTWGKPLEITGFDVHVAGTVTSWEMYQMVYETLLTTDESLNLQPGLAESWEQKSPTSYVFKIRAGAKFSNGRPVVADDVIGTIERIKDPATASYWGGQLGKIAKMSALDDHTVQVDLEAPYPAFLPALAHITAAIIPVKELKDGSFDPTKQLLGSGPFMVSDHKQDESWTLTRNPHYWRQGHPLVDRIDVPIIPDESARIAALRNGRIDFTTFENPDAPQALASDPNVKTATLKTTNYYRLDVNALKEKSPFHDRRVRQAMNLALDRQAISDLVFAGTTQPDYPVPAAFGKKACRDLPTYALPREERLVKARELLAGAGNTSPEVGLIATSANPVLGRIAQVVQQSLSEAGFKVNILQQPMAEYLQKVFTDGDFDFAASWLAGYTDPTMVISWWNPEFAVWNLAFQENVPDLSKALADVKTMQDGADRDAKLEEICRMIDESANLLALVSKVDYVVYRADEVAVKVPESSGSSNIYQYAAEFEALK